MSFLFAINFSFSVRVLVQVYYGSKQVEQKTSNLHLYSLIDDSSVVQDAWQWNLVQMTRYATIHAIPAVTLVVSNVFFLVILIISSPAFGFSQS